MSNYTKKELDDIIKFGTILKPPTHGWKIGDRFELNCNQKFFIAGTSGEVVVVEEYNMLEIKLDHLPNLRYHFHCSYLELEGWFAENG